MPKLLSDLLTIQCDCKKFTGDKNRVGLPDKTIEIFHSFTLILLIHYCLFPTFLILYVISVLSLINFGSEM